jgi:hypothetical protein
VLFIKDGQLFMQGPKEFLLTSENISQLYGCQLQLQRDNGRYSASFGNDGGEPIETTLEDKKKQPPVPEVLIEMRDTTVQYQERRPRSFELGHEAGVKTGPS